MGRLGCCCVRMFQLPYLPDLFYLELGVWSLELVACKYIPWVLGSLGFAYLNLGRVLLGLAMLHVVGGVEEEDTQDRA